MKKKFKIGMVGCGDVARYFALGVRLNPKIQIPACADICEENALRLAKKNRIKKCYSSYGEMLKNTKMDAVYLAVPHNLHFPMIKEAFENGLHVFCEKPIAINLDEGMEICRLSKETGLKVGINYQYRYDRACYAFARAAQKGDLGELYYGRCNLPWQRDVDYFSESQWHKKLSTAGGGTLITQASHILDALMWAMGKKPVAAFGMSANKKFKDIEVEDLSMGMLELEEGCFVQVSSSMAVTPELPVSIELYGAKGTAVYKGPESPKVRFFGVKPKKERPPTRGLHALFRSIEGFRRWIMDDMEYLIPAQQSLPVLAAIQAIYKSSESGKKESVDRRYLEYLT